MITATVIAAFGRQYECRSDEGERLLCYTRAKKSEVCCGDRVQVQRTAEAQGVIESLCERRNLLYRADAWKEKLIAANVSQVVIVTATEPAFSEELVARCLCAAEAQGIRCLVLLNKCDLHASLAQARARLAPIEAVGHEILELSAKGDLAPLRERLADEVSLLVGQSGMGKSTLTNALIPDAEAATREISQALDSGKHTTTHARLYALPDGGSLIDSPGLQAFGLAHLTRAELEQGFRELHGLAGQCRFRDCWHDHEPDCAVRTAVADGRMDERRYMLLRKLLTEHRNVPKR